MIIRKPLRPLLEGNDDQGTRRVILHIDMDAFFALIEQRAHPPWRKKPLIVAGHSMTRGVVCAASYEARPYGIRSGMSLAEARQLCPQAIIVPTDGVKYLDTAHRIFSHLEHYTPQVEIFSIDEAFLDITRTWSPYGSPRRLAMDIKGWIRQNFGLTASVGMAANKLLAKLATEQKKPDGFFEIYPDETGLFLENLPVEKLCGIGRHTQAHLNNLGIMTCGQLGRAQETLLVEQFGILGAVLKRMGQGKDNSPVNPVCSVEEVKSFGHSYTLLHNTTDPDTIQKYLRWLAEKVGARMRRDGYEGRTVTLTARFHDLKSIAKHRTLNYHLNDGDLIYREAVNIWSDLPIGQRQVRLLGISVSNLRSDSLQSWLLVEYRRRRQLISAIDRINAKYGAFTVHPAQLDFSNDQKISSGIIPLFGQGR